jgi:xylan 1,4-beta-xylosidase
LYWHISSIMISVKNTFERRLGIWPAGFDQDDVMWSNLAFGDYPHYLPGTEKAGQFTGWMLLNYDKPLQVSSTLGGFSPNKANDEDLKTYWSAASGDKGEWIQSDLGQLSTVHAIQINYADQDVADDRLGKRTDQFHQYILYHSMDGKKWEVLVDNSKNTTDIPHEYVELEIPVKTRHIKLENIHMPTGKFALSGFRVFGKGGGVRPEKVKQFMVFRTEKDKRSAFIKWSPMPDAYAYHISYGVAPDKLYNTIMVLGNNEYWLKTMDRTRPYYFTIESISENGVSEKYEVQRVE